MRHILHNDPNWDISKNAAIIRKTKQAMPKVFICHVCVVALSCNCNYQVIKMDTLPKTSQSK